MVRINGKEYQIDHDKLIDFITANGINLVYSVVEYNGVIVKKENIDKVVLMDGDSVEIVSFVGGG